MAGIVEAQESSAIIAGDNSYEPCSQRYQEPQSSRHGGTGIGTRSRQSVSRPRPSHIIATFRDTHLGLHDERIVSPGGSSTGRLFHPCRLAYRRKSARLKRGSPRRRKPSKNLPAVANMTYWSRAVLAPVVRFPTLST